MKVETFEIDIPDADLTELRERLTATRWPGPALSAAWENGSDLSFMQRLAAQWREQRTEAAWLDALIEANLKELGYGG